MAGTLPLTQVDHLYIDLNSVLHSALRTGITWEKFHKVLHSRLNDIVDKTNPRKTVMLAADGPAPLAKLITQRERRKKVSSKKEVKGAISSTALTPGTHFMADVTLSLAYWVHTKLSQHRFSHLQFELSDATVQGEGEVKILGRLARHWYAHGEKDTHVILGDDADLVLMACVSWMDNLYVANSAMAGLQQGIQSDMPVFCTALLHKAWLSKMFHPSHSQMKMGDRAKLLGAKMDLMLLAVLASGNDYLPPLRGVALSSGASGGLWPYYWSLRKSSSQGAASSICHVDEDTGVPYIDLMQLASLLRACTHYHEKADTDPWDGIKATADAGNYLRGCIWLLDMYINGTCPDYRYTYDGSAPSASRLIDACEQLAAEQQQPYLTHAQYGPLQPERLQPLLPFASAMALLPASGRSLMPAAARHLVGTSSPVLGDLFSECSTCNELGQRLKQASAEIVKHKSRVDTHKSRVDTLRSRRSGAAKSEELAEIARLDRELAKANEGYNAAKAMLHAASDDRMHHLRNAHPYAPFPIDRLARAASTVDLDDFEESELPLASFSSPVVVARAQGSPGSAPPSPFPHGFSRPIPKAVWRILESKPMAAVPSAADSYANGDGSAGSTTPSSAQPSGSSGLNGNGVVGGGQRGLGLRIERAQLQPDNLWVQGMQKRRYLAAPSSFAAKQQQMLPQQQRQQGAGSSSSWRRPPSPLSQEGSRKRFAPVAARSSSPGAAVEGGSRPSSARPGSGISTGSSADRAAFGVVDSDSLREPDNHNNPDAAETSNASFLASASHPMARGGRGRGRASFGGRGGGGQGRGASEGRGGRSGGRGGFGRGPPSGRGGRGQRAMQLQGRAHSGGDGVYAQLPVPPPPMPSAMLLSAASGARPAPQGPVAGRSYGGHFNPPQFPRPYPYIPHPAAPTPQAPSVFMYGQRTPSAQHLRWS
ncbi:XRN 5'-3' exonuclease N-terminus-domain-containing protein [Dunaliella salina]|uniref:XRN 5'-3' exonuclease N-terminus-domain-containing protein n=1 Tax=Dunaliella salina TaxID=3046 RepID=A0ABQ7G842_DUNSA|nr:XRN 5'-3' exonuclease N-terminus-domain-containing protein [Dunaliella salina]|eukprot:KAF5830776.1 XRN 5'-3' exonuclease N-terminus-domain-containing protein [Dunaliella salina]